MKVNALKIRSFGKLTGRIIDDLPEGLILITGNNESGKTTTMEFMRSTMFPSNKRKNYPEQTKNDSGSAELRMSSGEELVLMRNGKDVSELNGKDLPGKIFSMDSETYNSIFAMDLGDLENAEAISSGSIRNRFLTIPGGEAVPAVLKEIDRSGTDIMNEDRLTSKNPVYVLRKEIENINNEINSLRRQSDEYDTTAEEMDALIKNIKIAELDQSKTNEERSRRSILEAQRANVAAVNEYSEKMKDVEYATALTEEKITAHFELCGRMASLEEMIQRTDSTPPLTDEMMSRIRKAERDASAFLEKKTDVREMSVIAGTDTSVKQRAPGAKKGKSIVIPFIFFLAAGMSFAAYTLHPAMVFAGIALSATGTLIMVSKKKEQTPETITETMHVREQNAADISLISEIKDIFGGTGKNFTNMTDAVGTLREMTENNAARMLSRKMTEEMRGEIILKEKELLAIEEEYGGKEGFERTKADLRTFTDLNKMTDTLKKSVEDSTKTDYASVVRELSTEGASEMYTNCGINEMKIRQGELNVKLRNLRSDEHLNLLLAEKDAKETELADKIREWGVLSLQKYMIDRSCRDLYENMQPSVVKIANNYLGMMTRGRYTLDIDPRSEGINIRDATEYKTSRQWSSGLSDQVYLSIKMAVAKNMGSERLPMILDDVLVRFDPERKKAACEAIFEFAKDQQVFLFSCVPLDGMFPDGEYRHIRL